MHSNHHYPIGYALAFLPVVFFFILGSASAQESKYLGSEKTITHEELFQKAADNDFSQMIFQEIYKDSKNTYFALKMSGIDSRYAQIKLLELITKDKTIVNIGASPDATYGLFLVNNVHNQSAAQVAKTMNTLIDEVNTESATLSPEQQKQWLQKNDKYSEK